MVESTEIALRLHHTRIRAYKYFGNRNYSKAEGSSCKLKIENVLANTVIAESEWIE